MEKLVYEYLDSTVGGNPVLKKEKQIDIHRSNVFSSEIYYVNEIVVGSRKVGIKKITMKHELYNSVRKLFGLSHVDTSRYFNQWLNNIPDDK